MAQAYIDLIKNEGINFTTLFTSEQEIFWKIDSRRDISLKKVKGEIKLYLTEDRKTFSVSLSFWEKLFSLAESIELLISFFKENGGFTKDTRTQSRRLCHR